MRSRAIDVGLATQSWPDWALDVLKSAGIEAPWPPPAASWRWCWCRRFRRNWWAPAAVVVAAFGVITIWLYPVVIDPVFNDFEKLPPGPVRSDVLELAEEADVDVGEVYRVDASRRTSAANAYVNGLGHSKRVVLYDNLIAGFPRDEVRLVVAHELGHQKHNDLLRGLAWLALVAPAGHLPDPAARRAVRAPRRARRPWPQARADRAAGDRAGGDADLARARCRLERAVAPGGVARRRLRPRSHPAIPAAFVQFERRIALRNISDPDPPGLLHALFATHPTTLERIGFGEAWEKPE